MHSRGGHYTVLIKGGIKRILGLNYAKNKTILRISKQELKKRIVDYKLTYKGNKYPIIWVISKEKKCR